MLPAVVHYREFAPCEALREHVRAVAEDGAETTFTVTVRVDTPQEIEYYRNGGILPYVLRELAK